MIFLIFSLISFWFSVYIVFDLLCVYLNCILWFEMNVFGREIANIIKGCHSVSSLIESYAIK